MKRKYKILVFLTFAFILIISANVNLLAVADMGGGKCPEYFQGFRLDCKTVWCDLNHGYGGCSSSGNGNDCSTYKTCP